MSEFAERAQRKREADDAKPPARKGSLLPSDPPDPGATKDEFAGLRTVALGLCRPGQVRRPVRQTPGRPDGDQPPVRTADHVRASR